MWGHDTAILTLLYLILLTLWFHQIFKLIFPKSSSWPKTMYAEHWRKMGNFPILLVQLFSEQSTCEQLLTWICYCVFNQKSVLIGYFGFLFWFSSVVLFSKMKSLFLNLYTSSQWATSLLQLPINHGKCALIYKLKTFSLVKLWYTIWTYGGFTFQSNNIKKHPSHKYSFWNYLSRNSFLTRLIIIRLL